MDSSGLGGLGALDLRVEPPYAEVRGDLICLASWGFTSWDRQMYSRCHIGINISNIQSTCI